MARKALRRTSIMRNEMQIVRTPPGASEDWPAVNLRQFPNPNVTNFFLIPAQVNMGGRIANQLRARMIRLKFAMEFVPGTNLYSSVLNAYYRILIVQAFDVRQVTTLPVIADMLESTGTASSIGSNIEPIYSDYRSGKVVPSGAQRNRKFKVLYSKAQELYFYPGAVKNNEIFDVTLRFNKLLTYTGVGGTFAEQENPIFMYVFSDRDGNTVDNAYIRHRVFFKQYHQNV